jgi:choline dehydrogenase-like flavoprotein
MRANDPDVVVVGAGVAGASIAADLARGGIEVLLLERQREYRDRVRCHQRAEAADLVTSCTIARRHAARSQSAAEPRTWLTDGQSLFMMTMAAASWPSAGGLVDGHRHVPDVSVPSSGI